jgi:hypothetical protein
VQNREDHVPAEAGEFISAEAVDNLARDPEAGDLEGVGHAAAGLDADIALGVGPTAEDKNVRCFVTGFHVRARCERALFFPA